MANVYRPVQPGGALGQAEPTVTKPQIVHAVWTDASGKVVSGYLDMLPPDDPQPGDVPWEHILGYVPVTKPT